MKRRHLKMSKGRGSIPPDILMERVKAVVEAHKLKEKKSGTISRKKPSRKIA